MTRERDPVVLVHSSDLHIDDAGGPGAYTGLAGLRAVLAAARALGADAVLLAGDTFDNARISAARWVRPQHCWPRRRCRSCCCRAITIRSCRIVSTVGPE